jgi:hypothetical protein
MSGGVTEAIRRSLLVAMLLAGACTSAQPTGNARPTPVPRQAGCAVASAPGSLCILILGDSLGAGDPLTGDDRWWVRLQRALEPNLSGRPIAIDSWAVAASRIDLLESAARDQPELGTYDIAIVIEGVNDLFDMSVEEWRPRYQATIAALEAKGLTVVVATPPPNFENGTFGTLYDATAAMIREMAVAGRRPLLDIAARWRLAGAARAGTYYADPIHQGPAGQELMASMARDAVLEALARH